MRYITSFQFLTRFLDFRDETLSKIVTLMLCVDGNGDT
jgi:hypothetical protein